LSNNARVEIAKDEVRRTGIDSAKDLKETKKSKRKEERAKHFTLKRQAGNTLQTKVTR